MKQFKEGNNGRTMYANINRSYIDKIYSGEKTKDYREIKNFWTNQFRNREYRKPYDYIIYRNGRRKNARMLKIELIDITTSEAILELPYGTFFEECYVIHLGKIIWAKNFEKIKNPEIPTVVHPGVVILEELNQIDELNQMKLAHVSNINYQYLKQIIYDKSPITNEIAKALEVPLGISSAYLMKLQTKYNKKNEKTI